MEKESSEQPRPAKRIKLEKVSNNEDDDKNQTEADTDYFYFCMDCEDEENNIDDEIKTRYPLSIDLAGHINTTSHQNFAPIKDKMNLKLKNVSFSSEHNAIVIKNWRRLVKDGDITRFKYSPAKKCSKCDSVFEDSLDMFKHIKSSHMEM